MGNDEAGRLPHLDIAMPEDGAWLPGVDTPPFFTDHAFRVGDRFTYSQRLTADMVAEAAAWADLHVMPARDAPCIMVVARRLPDLPNGAWALNLCHLNSYEPTFGMVVEEIGPMVRLRTYDRNGNKGRIEPLERACLARIARPKFPIGSPIWLASGAVSGAAALHLADWDNPATNPVAALAAQPLLCEAIGFGVEEVLRATGLEAGDVWKIA